MIKLYKHTVSHRVIGGTLLVFLADEHPQLLQSTASIQAGGFCFANLLHTPADWQRRYKEATVKVKIGKFHCDVISSQKRSRSVFALPASAGEGWGLGVKKHLEEPVRTWTGLGNNSAVLSLAVSTAKSFPRTVTWICFNALHGRVWFSNQVHVWCCCSAWTSQSICSLSFQSKVKVVGGNSNWVCWLCSRSANMLLLLNLRNLTELEHTVKMFVGSRRLKSEQTKRKSGEIYRRSIKGLEGHWEEDRDAGDWRRVGPRQIIGCSDTSQRRGRRNLDI